MSEEKSNGKTHVQNPVESSALFSRTPLPGAAPSTQFEAAYRKQSRNSRSEDARAKLQRFALGRFFSFTRPGLIGVRRQTSHLTPQ
jgi:hypothetical protein